MDETPPLLREIIAGATIWLIVALATWFVGQGFSWPWVVVVALFALLLAAAGWALRLRWRISDIEARFRLSQDSEQTLQAFITMDDSLLRVLARYGAGAASVGPDYAVKNLLRDFSEVIGPDLSRGMLMLPSDDDPEFLVPFCGHEMAKETLDQATFYIGPSPNGSDRRRGVAGFAFVTGQVQIVHITKTDKGWTSDHSEYFQHDDGRPYPPYRTFAAIPVRLTKESECLGILCLDSQVSDLFDDQRTHSLLEQMGPRVATILMTLYDGTKPAP